MSGHNDLRCPDCPSFKYCRGKISKYSSACDDRRGFRSKKKSKRFNYLKELLRR